MNSVEIRQCFLDFFRQKEHRIVDSAPMVIKHDPTLMFTNAGMNQFKDIFLGNEKPAWKRVANAQKCLRVSGKHNDLEEVGHDTYHHTMFEMLGNWSFGDYFKKEAIEWAYEFLTRLVQIHPGRLYATVFEGSQEEHLEKDLESYELWKEYLPVEQILFGTRKDNFWEMGDSGPCGPCSEIHIDLRNDDERKKTAGHLLVNKDHPEVIEIWNLVFIEYNRRKDGALEPLPRKHVDTGMGFERLCMVAQNRRSNYDTDIFRPLIDEIAYLTSIKYGQGRESDTAMRVIADHVRAIAFAIADGQLPSNTKAGYVIRRILRRAVRYSYTFLKQSEPMIFRLVPALVKVMGEAYPDLHKQQALIQNVIREEEASFLKTLGTGLRLLEQIMDRAAKENNRTISGKMVFELYDTCGFPLDLTELILRERNMTFNLDEFHKEMDEQKKRSKHAATVETGEWIDLRPMKTTVFVGYETLTAQAQILRYRQVRSRDEILYQLVLDQTPFYAEAGGQMGDSGFLLAGGEKTEIIDTRQENNQVLHLTKNLPANPAAVFTATVDSHRRIMTANNHSATHLLHFALREVLGKHVEQKGSLVHPDYLRFDFSHFQKINDNELSTIEALVNRLIRDNLVLDEKRQIPMEEAKRMGALSLFGEKYGEQVRVVSFGKSVELCGGTHVQATGQIGLFKIISESAVAAGVRRIEALTSQKAEQYINEKLGQLRTIQMMLKNPSDPVSGVERLMKENAELEKRIGDLQNEALQKIRNEISEKAEWMHNMNVITALVQVDSADRLRDLSFQLKNKIENLYLVLGSNIKGKAHLSVMLSDNLVSDRQLNAVDIIRKISPVINGGGGGQPFFATAGGKNPGGLEKALAMARKIAGEA